MRQRVLPKLDRSAIAYLFMSSVIAVLAVACGGNVSPEPTVESAVPTERSATAAPTASALPDPTSTVQIEPTATTVPATPTHIPSGDGAVLGFTIDEYTTWRDLFDSRESPDEDCLRRALGESLEGAIAQTDINPILLDKLLPCLDPEISRDILPVVTMVGLAQEGWELSQEEVSCLRKEIGDVEVVAYASGEEGAVEDFAKGTILCVPRPLIHQFVAGLGIESRELSEVEITCLQQGLLAVNWGTVLADESGANRYVLSVLFGCMPDPVISLLISRFGISTADLDENEAICLRERLSSLRLAGRSTG